MIAPSILSADFSRLGEQVREVEAAGADRIHVDVMDGHFVPNLSMGAVVVKGLRPVTKLPLEVHLMVEDPGRFLDGFVKAGADTLIVHLEVLPDPRPMLEHIRRGLGKKVGLAFNPDMPVDEGRAVPARHRPGAVHDRVPGLRRAGVHPREHGAGARSCASW